VSKGNHRHRRVPPPLISNLTSINSRTPSKRGSPSSDPDEEDFQVVTHHKQNKKETNLFI
ncbi:unnamed protein product, partial [Rotaria magnacalcarata]